MKRFHVFAGLCILSVIYTLSFILWRNENEADILEWEDGAIPISYTDKQWTPYEPVKEEHYSEDVESPDYIRSQISDNFYLPVYPSSSSRPAAQAPDWQQIPLSCLDELFDNGPSCSSGWQIDQYFDFVWTWVNSSDPVWSQARASISSRLLGKHGEIEMDDNKTMAHFRNYDELRHSVRSALMHFRPYARQFIILASDFAPPERQTESASTLRLGQVPQWLDSTRDTLEWRDGGVQLKIQHHANLFRPYFETIFNSFAIEAQLGKLQNVNDLFVYINDDMYFLRDLKPSDFFTSAFGFVFRLVYWFPVPPTLDPEPVRGEWQALRESNVLISQRFGFATRPYRVHMPKIMSVSILREMAETFSEAFARTGARPMRAVWLDGAAGDVHPGFMFAHFVIERWREGLLWSWAVARLGGDDDSWDSAAAWAELQGGAREIVVGRIVRDTLSKPVQQLRKAGYEGPEASQYYFSSMDGYPYYEMRKNASMKHPNLLYPMLCTISRKECFPSEIKSASEAFKHIAFVNPQCGDCIINRLVQNSGRSGLSAVLPLPGRMLALTARGPISETLPRVPSWNLGAFALAGVLAQTLSSEMLDVRAWTLRMLNRYRFVLVDSPYTFARLEDEKNAYSQLNALQGHTKAFACVNDDVESDEDAVAVERVMREWQETRWGTPAGWEAT